MRRARDRVPLGIVRWLGSFPFERGKVDQRAANIGDVDHADEAGVAGDWQVPEMAAGHDDCCVPDAGRGVDDGRSWIRTSLRFFPSATAWSVSSIVVSGGRMRSAMVAWLGDGWAACPAEASVMFCSMETSHARGYIPAS